MDVAWEYADKGSKVCLIYIIDIRSRPWKMIRETSFSVSTRMFSDRRGVGHDGIHQARRHPQKNFAQ